jgi:hypothetical protein
VAQALRSHPQEPFDILYGRGDDLDPAVEVLDPAHRIES